MSYFSTDPLHIIDRPSDQLHKGGTRFGYRYIVMHATVGGLESSLRWLTTASPPSNPVSVQRVVSKSGQLYKLTDDAEVAWHAGFATIGPLPRRNAQGVVVESVNQWSLGIELENDNSGHDAYPLVQIKTTAKQVAEWIGAYGYLAIVGHSWIDARKSDPAGFPWDVFYRLLDNEVVRARR